MKPSDMHDLTAVSKKRINVAQGFRLVSFNSGMYVERAERGLSGSLSVMPVACKDLWC